MSRIITPAAGPPFRAEFVTRLWQARSHAEAAERSRAEDAENAEKREMVRAGTHRFDEITIAECPRSHHPRELCGLSDLCARSFLCALGAISPGRAGRRPDNNLAVEQDVARGNVRASDAFQHCSQRGVAKLTRRLA